MKITETRIRQIIKEEMTSILGHGLNENTVAWSFLKDAVSGRKIEIGGKVNGQPGLWLFLYIDGKRQPNLLDKNTEKLLARELETRGMNAVIEDLRSVAKEVINKLHNKDGSIAKGHDGPGGRPAGRW